MKYLMIILLVVLGVGIGVFVGLGALDGIEWVIFIVIFPLAYIFGAILLGKKSDDEVVKKEIKSKWDKYE